MLSGVPKIELSPSLSQPHELARHASAYGAIRILERPHDGAREYWQGEALHTLAFADGESLFGHIHVIDHVIRDAPSVLILGGAGGSLATMCARRGARTTVVELEPLAHAIARNYFGLHPQIRWITGDAAAYVSTCNERFDAVVVDSFNCRGDTSIHGSAAQISALIPLLTCSGALLANFAGIDGPSPSAWPITCALQTEGYTAALLRADRGDEGNEVLVVQNERRALSLETLDPDRRPSAAQDYLRSLRIVGFEI